MRYQPRKVLAEREREGESEREGERGRERERESEVNEVRAAEGVPNSALESQSGMPLLVRKCNSSACPHVSCPRYYVQV